MAVDRGGLQYTIALKDEFSANAAKFVASIKGAKTAFAEFQAGIKTTKDSAASFAKTTKAVDENAAALKRLQAQSRAQQQIERTAQRTNAAAQADAAKFARDNLSTQKAAAKAEADNLKAQQLAIKAKVDAQNRSAAQAQKLEAARRKDEAQALSDQQRNLKAVVDAQNKREQIAQRIAAQQSKDAQRQASSQIDFQAQQKINEGIQAELVTRKQITLLRQQSANQLAKGDLIGSGRSLQQARQLQDSLNSIGKSAGQAFFTFRRLVGILAVFTIARETVQGFQTLVSEALQFNSVMESAKTSVAGLLLATAQVRDQFGRNLDSAQAFTAALGIANEQIKKLQQSAIQLGVPFDRLVETFQIAVAPGFGAGLNIDQIRKLTVSISAAAKAVGLPQNQLAEEIRSLLAGTIQARTTRIATSLGITNADVKRLKETGQLFDFLEAKFKSFNVAAERQARSTLTGLQEVVGGIIKQIIGEAAQPLFATLIELGNQLIDNVLRVKDAAGNITINPKVVASFRAIFDALKNGLLEIRDFAQNLGFDGIESAFKAVGATILATLRFAIGFAEALAQVLGTVVKGFRAVAGFIGLTDKGLGNIAGTLGGVIALTAVWDHTIGLLGFKISDVALLLKDVMPAALKGVAADVGIVAAIIAAAGIGFDFWLSSLFDVNLSLAETAKLIELGLIGGLRDFATLLQKTAIQFKGAFSFKTQEQINDQKTAADEANLARQKQINDEIAAITTKASEKSAKGAGFDPFAVAKKSAEGFGGILSGVNRQVKELDALLTTINDDLFKTGKEFSVAFNNPALQGPAGKIQSIFSDKDVKLAEDLKKINIERASVEKQIADITKQQNITAERRAQLQQVADGALNDQQVKALKINQAEGQVVSLLQDQADIRGVIAQLDEKSVDLAIKKAALVAIEAARDLNREAVLLREQAIAEQAITNVVVQRLGARRQAVVEAENAVNIARAEAAQAQDDLQKQIALVQKKLDLTNRTGPGGPTAAERDALGQLLTSLQDRLGLEKSIADAKERQLENARQEAALIESGSITQGIQRGLGDLVKELPSAFEQGVNIIKGLVTNLTDFISTSIVAAFDPTNDQSLQERFARFLQGIAQIILQQILQLAIASALNSALGEATKSAEQIATATTIASIQVTAATTIAGIQVTAAQTIAALKIGSLGLANGGLVSGFAEGGLIPRAQRAATRAHAFAEGYATGGPRRPAGLNPSDTIPAWLAPGEFVIRKGVVDALGAGFFSAVNQGKFALATAPASGSAAPASAGLARGGLVADQVQRAQASSQGGDSKTQVIPVQVAGEKELDRILAGGKNAFLRMIRENASTINAQLKGGK